MIYFLVIKQIIIKYMIIFYFLNKTNDQHNSKNYG
jgi:hypothetical protein